MEMIAELVTTGTEILLGQIVNTNAQYLSARLAELGINLFFQTTVGDNRVRMEEAIRHALSRSDIVITTGGLGPTLGDITKEVCASVFNRELEFNEEVWAGIQKFFVARELRVSENNKRQAMIPKGAMILANKRGTAPGIVLEQGVKIIINLPGPPHEMVGMFEDEAVPYLTHKFKLQQIIRSRVLRCFGMGESVIEENIKLFIKNQGNPTIALLAREGEVHIRLTACGADTASSEKMLQELEGEIRTQIGSFIFGTDEETLAQVVGSLLVKGGYTVACAESCTGGMIAAQFTDIPGSSRYFLQGIVCYSNQAKSNQLGVREATLQTHGAVSAQTAQEMAEGLRRIAGTDFALATTGVAGPDGGTEEKPVGLVFVGMAGPAGTVVQQYHFLGSRNFIRQRSAKAALELLRRNLSGIDFK